MFSLKTSGPASDANPVGEGMQRRQGTRAALNPGTFTTV